MKYWQSGNLNLGIKEYKNNIGNLLWILRSTQISDTSGIYLFACFVIILIGWHVSNPNTESCFIFLVACIN